MHSYHPKSLRLKILPLSPYNSEILMPNRRVALVYGRISGSVVTSDGDERYLLEIRVVVVFVRFALGWSDLLDSGSCRHHRAEVLRVDLVKCGRILQIVEVHIRGHNLIEAHAGFLEVVEEIAHGLPK